MTTSADISLTPQIIRKGDNAEYAVLPWEQYQALLEHLEDLEDLLAIRKARADDDGTRISHEQVKQELGL
ncbi:MAG: hypothetical protein WD042_16965 [Phycisphaeraceae bacterium]